MVHRLKVSFLVAGLEENFVMNRNTSVRLQFTKELGKNLTHALLMHMR